MLEIKSNMSSEALSDDDFRRFDPGCSQDRSVVEDSLFFIDLLMYSGSGSRSSKELSACVAGLLWFILKSSLSYIVFMKYGSRKGRKYDVMGR